MPAEIDLLAIGRGSVTAPAGCGKTHLIATTLVRHSGPKPVLVLTHTNAGAAALRQRMNKAGVAASAFKVATIDGFAMRLVSMFPMRSACDLRILEIRDPRNDYPAIRNAAYNLIRNGHLTAALSATYARLLVDEYQDCNVVQHAIVDGLADMLPTVVLGDPMQAIFGFAGNQLVDWERDVITQFPPVSELATPWRWINAGTEELGRWLLHVRAELRLGRSIDVSTAIPNMQWTRLNAADLERGRRAAALTRLQENENTILIIGDARNPRGRHQLTSQTPGAVSVEAVDLGDLTHFARRFDLSRPDALELLINFAAETMTGVAAAALLGRLETLQSGRAIKPPSPVETAALAFRANPSCKAALELLQRLEEQPDARVFRPEVLHCCRSAMRAVVSGGGTFLKEVLQARERNRHQGRPVARRAVGSTLLLKGLEADVAVILQPEVMDACNLYVALTRGARRLVVCSSANWIPA
ncbi:UvrD-helicase domain-containing protein [Derxia gummosa]|uniref:DNA 3'-5' helicase II n=1 Tax=Derxia gummosa DSM 723 TaxID=1121388 RepID=A0A8B6X886_9BURK|nr:UvrD-helicase domain-containing protein [Derxia gummosa]